MKDRFKNNSNRSISLGDKYPTFKKGFVSVLGFDDIFPLGKHKGKKIIDLINNNFAFIKWALKERVVVFSKEVMDEIMERKKASFKELPIDKQLEFFAIVNERRTKIKTLNDTKKKQPAIDMPKTTWNELGEEVPIKRRRHFKF